METKLLKSGGARKTLTRRNRLVLSTGIVPIYVPFLFLLPALLLLIVFRYYPAVSAIYHSFTKWVIPREATWIGWGNYIELFQDPTFLKSVGNVLIYSIATTAISTFMALLGAELVYNLKSDRARRFWRTLFTIPMIIPVTVTFLIWKQIFAGRGGFLNQLLLDLGIIERGIPWFGQPSTALGALISIGFPFIAGFSFLVLLAGLENLSTEVGEAARIDGCNVLQRIMYIDLPSLRGPLALAIILSLSGGLQQFTPMLVVTGGGPVNSTMSPALYLYLQAFNYGQYGYATAIGTVLMLLTLGLSGVVLWVRYRKAHDVTV